jgi:hypothetical protein
VNRVKRPNTWLHRPMLQNVKKALANPEPSTHDPEPTLHHASAFAVRLFHLKYLKGGRDCDGYGKPSGGLLSAPLA